MSPHRGWPAGEWQGPWLVASCAALLIALFVAIRPDLVFTSAFLVQDQGTHVFVSARLAQGAALYRDIAYPYGALPALLGGAVASSIGISARIFVVLQALLNLAFLFLLTRQVGRYVPPRTAAAIVLLAVLPLSMAPSATAGGAASNTYIGLERLVLVCLFTSWTPPEERTDANSTVAGFTLGLWELVKVGGAAVGLAGWLVVDLLCVRQAVGRRMLRSWAVMLGVAAVVEGCRWLALFALLPAPIALDAAWPYFALEHYRSIPSAVRARGLTVVELATHAAVPAASLALAVFALRGQLKRIEGRRALALLVPGVFFVLGWAGYFGHREIMWQYAWAAVPGAAFALAHGPRILAVGASVVAMPALALLLATMMGAIRVGASQPMPMPNGDTIWLNPAARVAVIETLALLRNDAGSGKPSRTMVFPSGGGLYFYSGAMLPTRHAWLIDRYVRPHEQDAVFAQVRDIEHLVMLNETGLTAARFDARVGEILGRRVADLWSGRVSRIEHRPGWSLVTLRPPDSADASVVSTR